MTADRRIRYFINAQTRERLAWDAPTMPPLDPPISRAHGWTEIDRDAYRVLSRLHAPVTQTNIARMYSRAALIKGGVTT